MKKILIISYYFAPCPAIGAKRWSEFFSLLAQSEYDVTVLTANWEGQKIPDKAIHYIGEPVKFNPSQSINRNFTFLDILKHPSISLRSIDRMTFHNPWLFKAKQWIDTHKNENYDVIIASYTPISAIRLGSYAKHVYTAKYLLDVRDMMSLQGQKKRIPLLHCFDKLLDKFWVRHVDEILVVGPTLQQKASRFYKRPVHLIYNGFMQKEYTPREYHNQLKENKEIVFSYLGTMGNTRNPRVLIEWLNKFFGNHKEYQAEINFASQDDPHSFLQNLPIEHIKINWLGYLGQDAIRNLKDKTDIFILLEDILPQGKENVTGKVFEYLVEQKPIIASCHPESDIHCVLENTGAGKIMTSFTECENFLLTIMDNELKINQEKTLHYSRESQLGLLKKLF